MSKTIFAPGQQVMFAPESPWLPPDLNELPAWEGAKRVGIDCETRDPTLKTRGIGVRHGGYVVGISFALEDNRGYYLPIRHDGGGNIDEKKALEYLKIQAKNYTGDIVGANLPYDLDYLAQEGVVFKRARYFRDVQIADPLINELHFSYSLQNIAKRHGVLGKDEELLRFAASVYGLDPKADLWRLHSKYVGAYAEEDATLPLRILRRQERIIDEENLWQIYNIESQLLPVLVRMRRRGVLIDQDRLQKGEQYTLEEEAKALKEIRRLTGCQIAVGEVWQSKIMARPLEHLGVKLELDKNKNPSINADVLNNLDHPVGALMLRARKINKARTTFIESIKNHMANGRIHATFNQLKRQKDDGSDDSYGAAFGRLSCVNPNLQQQPSPDKDPEIGGFVRSFYIPDGNGLWAANDYSQQEPRWLTHFAEHCQLPKAKKAGDKYRNDPNTDNHQMMADMCGIPRKPAKTIYLGLCYGMGGKKLALGLHKPTGWLVLTNRRKYYFDYEYKSDAFKKMQETGGRILEVAGKEAQQLMDVFDHKAPYVRKLARLAESQAKKNGFVTTILGRRCRFPSDDNGNFDWTHKALNRLIQGSSGDQTKKAMIDVDAAGYKLQIQVHDELGQTVGSPKQAAEIAEIMENCVECSVPSKVDVEIGPSWGESH